MLVQRCPFLKSIAHMRSIPSLFCPRNNFLSQTPSPLTCGTTYLCALSPEKSRCQLCDTQYCQRVNKMGKQTKQKEIKTFGRFNNKYFSQTDKIMLYYYMILNYKTLLFRFCFFFFNSPNLLF